MREPGRVEQRPGVAGDRRRWRRADRHRDQSRAVQEVQLPPVRRPARFDPPPLDTCQRPPVVGRKRPHVDLVGSRLVRRVGQPAPVRRHRRVQLGEAARDQRHRRVSPLGRGRRRCPRRPAPRRRSGAPASARRATRSPPAPGGRAAPASRSGVLPSVTRAYTLVPLSESRMNATCPPSGDQAGRRSCPPKVSRVNGPRSSCLIQMPSAPFARPTPTASRRPSGDSDNELNAAVPGACRSPSRRRPGVTRTISNSTAAPPPCT